jgi:hypothetical protein
MGVRYVVVPERLAPAPFGTDQLRAPAGLRATLDAQLDLEPLDVPAGLSVFRNQAFFPPRAVVSRANTPPEQGGISAATAIDLSAARLALPDDDGHLRWSGPAEADSTVLLSASHSDRWELVVDGETMPQTKPFGWGNGFTVAEAGDATLTFRTPTLRYVALLIQVLVWLWLARTLLRARLRSTARPGAHL